MKLQILKSAKVELNNLRLSFASTKNFTTSKSESDIVYEIKEQGYCIIEKAFSLEYCESLRNEIDKIIIDYKDQIWKDEASSDHRLFGAERIGKDINTYFKDKFIRRVLQTYEGVEVNEGFTLGARLEAKKGNKGSGGGWHRDHPNYKQSKSILYLSDVNSENGPFQYLTGSHKSTSVYRDSFKYNLDPFQNRFEDSDIDSIIHQEPDRLKTFLGKAGTLLLVDTRGIHRGKPIKQGKRYALTNYYWTRSNIPTHIKNKLLVQNTESAVINES